MRKETQSRKGRDIRVWYSGKALARVEHEAECEGMSPGRYIRQRMDEYFMNRDRVAQLMVSAEADSEVEAEGIIGNLLTGLESRLSHSMARQLTAAERSARNLEVLLAMVDRLVYMYLQHTPDIPEEQATGRKVSADVRMQQYKAQVRKKLLGEGAD